MLVVPLSLFGAQELRLQPPKPPGLEKIALTNVLESIKTLIVLDVTVAIQSNGTNAETIAYYYLSIYQAFTNMPVTVNFVVTEIEKVPTPMHVEVSALRNVIVTMYSRAYDYRLRGDVSPIEWLPRIAETFAQSIRQGIIDGGKGNVLQ